MLKGIHLDKLSGFGISARNFPGPLFDEKDTSDFHIIKCMNLNARLEQT